MSQPKEYDIFISYSRNDLAEVKAFKETIEKRVPGIRIWFDMTGIESGAEFVDKIHSAIRRSSLMLFCLSDNAIKSKWTKKEVLFADEISKPIVPILLRGSKLNESDWCHFFFSNVNCINSTDTEQVEILIRDLKNLTPQPVLKPEPAPIPIPNSKPTSKPNPHPAPKPKPNPSSTMFRQRTAKQKRATKKTWIWIGVALVSVLCFVFCSITNHIKYEIVDGEAVVKGHSAIMRGNIVIPSTIKRQGATYSVTSIGEDAFRWCDGFTSVSIPNSVTSIGNSAFCHCDGLTFLSIPNSVTSIGSYAFWGCEGLISVSIPNSVTSLGDYAFYSCYGLTSVSIPNSVTTIGNSAFCSCNGLKSVTIPNSVTSIGWSAFAGCSSLTSVTIPESVTNIEASAFKNCDNLKSVTIKDPKCRIRADAFEGCHPDLVIRK